ncbi:MAG: hypothetical protein WCO00_01770 [Rhodospirillaceae bacterium]
MSPAKLFMLRFLILLVAIALPAGGIAFWAGKPAKYDLPTLEAWAPVKEAGPSARALADGLTRVAGPARPQPPEWFNAEDQSLLAKAEAAWRGGKLQEGLGHLMVLSSRLDDQGKTMADFLPLVAPDIASWLLSSYFAPLLLGVLLVFFAFLVFLPWLVRRLIDALKVLIGIAIAVAAIVGAIGLCLSLSSHHALVFTLIEYFVAVVVLTLVGNLWLAFRRGRAPRRVIPAAEPAPAAVPLRRESRVVQPLVPRGRASELPPPALAEPPAPEPLPAGALREREAGN